MSYLIKVGQLLLAFAITVNTVFAQEQEPRLCDKACCSADFNPAGIMIGPTHNKGQFMASFRYMGMYMNGTVENNKPVGNDYVMNTYISSPEKMYMQMYMLMFMYGITSRLTVMGMGTYNVNSMSMRMYAGHGHMHSNTTVDGTAKVTMTNGGLSDPSVYLLYRIIKRSKHVLEAGSGFSLPFGSVNARGDTNTMYSGYRLPYLMQAGNGTFDLLPFVTYRYESNRFYYSCQFTPVIRTNFNKYGYRAGQKITINNWAIWRWNNTISSSARLEASYSESLAGRDNKVYTWMEPSANPLNYGGYKAFGFLGMNLNFQQGLLKGHTPSVEIGLPVYQHLNGIQMKHKAAINFSWTFTI